MINRRLLRIKTIQILYAYFQSDDKTINQSEKELFHSIEKYYDLYHYLFILIIDIADHSRRIMDMRKTKRMPTHEDLNPNTRFVDNAVIQQINNTKELENYINHQKMSLDNYPELIKRLYNEIIESDVYKKYMENENTSFRKDKDIIINIFKNHIGNCELLFQNLEEQSIYWNDDIDFAISMAIKTLKQCKKNNHNSIPLLPLYKDADDKEFVKTLFRKTVLNFKETKELIRAHTKNWDFERIAFMDIIIMQTAVNEILAFETIPIKASLNEYIEIAKYYSTKQSSTFINGILDRLIHSLVTEDKIVKTGRGLVGEHRLTEKKQ